MKTARIAPLALLALLASPLAPARPAERINDHHPILFSDGSGASWIVLGGSLKGRWLKATELPTKRLKKVEGDRLDAYQVDTPLVRGDEVFAIYAGGGLLRRARAKGRPVLWNVPSNGEDCLELELEGKLAPGDTRTGSPIVGVNGNWDAMPRKLKPLGKNRFSVDVDKDGVEEVIQRSDRYVKAEDDGKPIKKLVSKLELIKEKKVFPIYSFEQVPIYTDNYRWLAVDLDGDGDLEIVTLDQGHNGEIQVHDFKPGRGWAVVLSYSWGD